MSFLAPFLPAVLIAGMLVAVAFVRRPEWMLGAFVVGDVTGLNHAIAGHLVSPFWPMLAACVVILLVRLLGERRITVPRSPVLIAVVALLAYMVVITGINARTGDGAVLLDRVLSTLTFAVVFGLLVVTSSTERMARVVVIGFAVLAGVTIVHDVVLGNRGTLLGLSNYQVTSTLGVTDLRHSGPVADVNFWARLLLLAIPMAMSMLLLARRSRRPAWIVAVGALLGGLVLTGSRGSWLSLLPAVAVWCALAEPRRTIRYLPVAAIVAVPLVIISGVGSRLATVASFGAEPTSGGADQSLVDRARLTGAAFRMFLDRPLSGRGVGAFSHLFPAYDRMSDSLYQLPNQTGAHNFYVEQLAEGGVLGLALWAVLFITAFLAAAHTISAPACRASERLVVIGALSGLVGWLAASAFLHLADLRSLLFFIACLAAVEASVRVRTQIPPDAVIRRRRPAAPAETFRRVLISGFAVCLGAVVVCAASSIAGTSGRWQSSTLAVVAPPEGDDTWLLGYQTDLISRGQLAASLSIALSEIDLLPADADADVEVSLIESRAGLLIDVTAATPALARAAMADAVVAAQAAVARFDTGYEFAVGPSGAPTPDDAGRLLDPSLAQPLFWSGLVGSLVLLGLIVTSNRSLLDGPERTRTQIVRSTSCAS